MDRPNVERLAEVADCSGWDSSPLSCETVAYTLHLEGLIREALADLPTSSDGELDVYSRFRVNNVRESLTLQEQR